MDNITLAIALAKARYDAMVAYRENAEDWQEKQAEYERLQDQADANAE